MKIDNFDYEIPENLIAQRPAESRGEDRLFVLSKESAHKEFENICEYFDSNDVLVLNETKVIPVRFFGFTPRSGKVEILLLNPLEVISKNGNCHWKTLLKKKRRKSGMVFEFPDGLKLVTVSFGEGGGANLKPVSGERFPSDISSWIETHGLLPIPPYIRGGLSDERDRENYQTVYANNPGSVAAPTAGLHFTQSLISKLESQGVEIIKLTLHVGIGTFKPIQTEFVEDHTMHEEEYEISAEGMNKLRDALDKKKRITAVGTTVVRTLESLWDCLENKDSQETEFDMDAVTGKTGLYIKPGFKFNVVDRMLTNFHLPKSSLLVMVSAFAGKDRVMKAYEEAKQKEYRFFSYGDAMLIDRNS